jgi:hypothetical protein
MLQRLSGAAIATLTVAISLSGCQPRAASPGVKATQETEKPAVEIKKILKISVSATGSITADGAPITLEQLGPKLAELKQAGGAVFYHRENATGEPHPNAMGVMELVVKNKLPIRLSSSPDFSDSVTGGAKSGPDSK